ncbi:type II toxin-antitoxin system PemK/MazF family toxin [bacterium]|nr:type II toxin-antitoxin system PemK/MazF family toxin [bacterium]
MPDIRWGIFWADLNPVRGAEQAGIRPAIVVSRESIHRALPLVGVCPITSRKPGRKIYPTEVVIPAGHAGLTMESVVLGHQVRTISRERIGARLGSLEDDDVKLAILQALAVFFSLDT